MFVNVMPNRGDWNVCVEAFAVISITIRHHVNEHVENMLTNMLITSMLSTCHEHVGISKKCQKYSNVQNALTFGYQTFGYDLGQNV